MIEIIDLRANSDSKAGFFKKLECGKAGYAAEVMKTVEEIIENVRLDGDAALVEYTRKFDGVDLKPGMLRVAPREMEEACSHVDGRLIEAIKNAKRNIERFHEKQKKNSWFMAENEGVFLGQLCRPLEAVGIYVPGGTAAYPSSVLMNAIPAKVAGVRRIVMVTPPRDDGSIDPAILAAAKEAGVDEIYRIGGAQAIAALALGTETVPKVDKIAGPGNIYVACAKKAVYGHCDVDMIAGPSEILVIADDTADARFVAADLLSQAEHDRMASAILATTSKKLAFEVKEEIERQTRLLERKAIIESSLGACGSIAIVGSMEEALCIAERIAPEHLELCVAEPFGLLASVKNAGAVFLGHYSPEPLGDYIAGPNHVLPTGGTARFFSPLGVEDFMKKINIVSYAKEALEQVKDDIAVLAEAEGLTAHANAVKIRFEQKGMVDA